MRGSTLWELRTRVFWRYYLLLTRCKLKVGNTQTFSYWVFFQDTTAVFVHFKKNEKLQLYRNCEPTQNCSKFVYNCSFSSVLEGAGIGLKHYYEPNVFFFLYCFRFFNLCTCFLCVSVFVCSLTFLPFTFAKNSLTTFIYTLIAWITFKNNNSLFNIEPVHQLFVTQYFVRFFSLLCTFKTAVSPSKTNGGRSSQRALKVLCSKEPYFESFFYYTQLFSQWFFCPLISACRKNVKKNTKTA